MTIGRMRRSLAVPLILLTGAFLAVPLALYSILEQAFESQQDLLTRSVETQARIAAAAIAPDLNETDPTTFATAARDLARLAGGDATVQLLFRPSDRMDALDFYRVGQASVAESSGAGDQGQAGVREDLRRVAAEACAVDKLQTSRYRDPSGIGDALASIVPIRTAGGCWAVLFAYPAADLLGATQTMPFYRRPEVERAAILYVGLALLTLCVIAALQRNLAQFREVASAIRLDAQRGPSFHARNQIAELDRVADELDRLVASLRRGSEEIRRRTEDDAHALKTPLAILRQAILPIGSAIPEANESARRALQVLSQMVDRMDNLVDHSRRVDESVAELNDPPRRRVDISRMLRRLVQAYGALAEGRGIMLDAEIMANVRVEGSEELIETAIEAVLDDVISSRPAGSHVAIQLRRLESRAEIAVANNGPGIPPEQGYRLFEPRFSLAVANDPTEASAVLNVSGLWTARRNLQAMGGGVRVENSPGQGMLIHLDLPLVGAPPSGRQLRRAAVPDGPLKD
jgi:two-component system, OmpR family, sensor histidine kinase ChvG